MHKIDLIHDGNEPQQNLEISDSKVPKYNQHRPEKLVVSKVISENQKWKQCKIIGKNVSIRSYSASCAFQKKFYIYGGYQILNGMMDDFYSIDLNDKVEKFDWNQIHYKGDSPGPRSKHALIGAKNKIYLVAGLCTNIKSSNQIFAYDPSNNSWELMKPVGETLPCLDSFGCAYVCHQDEQKIIIIGGYNDQTAQFLNTVYEYNITKNKISILYAGSQESKQGVPVPRSGCAAAADDKNIYMFGGKNSGDRMNDMWEFSLIDFKFRELQKAGDIPYERNGHTMTYFEGKLYVFGGIHDITWQLDDLIVYNIKKQRWVTLEQDSPRKVQKKLSPSKSIQKEKKSIPKKKNWYETNNSFTHSKDKSFSPSFVNRTVYRQQDSPQNPGRMIEEQKKKAFLQRKANMLKNFEVSKEEANRYVTLEAESQAIRNSLDVIGNPDPKNKVPQDKLTDFGRETESKFLQPLTNNSNLIIGKKPCARDGHCATILQDQLIIFAGDRHQMSFNDLYKLDFGMVIKNNLQN